MALTGPSFFDTSVLVAGVVDMGPSSEASQRILDAVADGRLQQPMTAWHCCLEFYAVLTRLPEELRVPPPVAHQLVRSEVIARFDVRQLAEDQRLPFFLEVERERVVGGRLYDAHIAEVARVARAGTVVTDNRRHFTSLMRHGVVVLSAEELVEEEGL